MSLAENEMDEQVAYAWERGARGAVGYIAGKIRKEAAELLNANKGLDDHSDEYGSNARRAVACSEIANYVDKLGEEYISNEGRTEV